MKKQKITIDNIQSLLYGDDSKRAFLYVHGKNSRKEDAESFAEIVTRKNYQVISFDLPQHGERIDKDYPCNVQNGVHDLSKIYNAIKDNFNDISLFACSLGAYFSLVAYRELYFSKCLFLSPILDMERLIKNMMLWSNVTEEQLEREKEIETAFGEKLSWDYYQFVKANRIIKWNSPTSILYGENDNLTEREVLESFAGRFNCKVEIMKDGEHYFHTPEQLKVLANWIINN
jgi:uncharacterized protein